jgi:hypothetical protein
MAGVSVITAAALLVLAGCAGDRSVAREDVALWCYSTLADPECYTEPDPTRRTGFLGAVPAE